MAALGYARRGWYVFPLGTGTKGMDAQGRSTHLLSNGHNGASNDLETIRNWWTRWPDANIGLHLAASGLVALDPDLYKPDCGWDAFVADKVVPDTLIQRSARGGRHYIYRADPECRFAGTLCSGVEIKHRGYILLAPSNFEGRPYVIKNDIKPAPVPEWVPCKSHPDVIARSERTPPVATFATSGDTGTGASELDELLAWIDPDASGYLAWIEVLQGLHDHFNGGDDGLALAEAWSADGAKFRSGEVARKWRSFTAGSGVTLATIAHRARENGADLSEIARRHCRAGVTLQRQGARHGCDVASMASDNSPDLSHDHLALDLGARSWDADARHVALWDSWLFWDGTRWRRDETLDHLSRVRGFLRTRALELTQWADCRAEMQEIAHDGKKVEKIKTWARDQAKTLRSSATVAAVSALARANSASATTHVAFDADRMLLGTPGGTADLRTGILRPARRNDMISRLTTCAPAETGTAPTLWLQFLQDVFEGDSDTIAFLQRAAGYALTGATSEHKLLFLHGAGRNGKSVFLNTLLDLWGDYGRRVAATTFLNAQTERHPTDIAGLQGARLAIASELPRGKTWDEAVIKDLTGGDRMTARFMRQCGVGSRSGHALAPFPCGKKSF